MLIFKSLDIVYYFVVYVNLWVSALPNDGVYSRFIDASPKYQKITVPAILYGPYFPRPPLYTLPQTPDDPSIDQ